MALQSLLSVLGICSWALPLWTKSPVKSLRIQWEAHDNVRRVTTIRFLFGCLTQLSLQMTNYSPSQHLTAMTSEAVSKNHPAKTSQPSEPWKPITDNCFKSQCFRVTYDITIGNQNTHTARKWQSWDWNPGSLGVEPLLLNRILHWPSNAAADDYGYIVSDDNYRCALSKQAGR